MRRWRAAGMGLAAGSLLLTTGCAGASAQSAGLAASSHKAQPLRVSWVMPRPGQRVGVGMPIIVYFNRPVSSRRTVERLLHVTSQKAATGAWFWVSSSEAIFRTRSYWSPNQKVTFTAHLVGAKLGPTEYGAADYSETFTIGNSQISQVSTVTHRMKVYINGKLAQDVGISAGRGGSVRYTTTSGIHLTMEADASVVMTSPGIAKGQPGYYSETVYDAVRISNSGEFVHAAPWSVAEQGKSNVSHGCINASPAFAKWFYDHAEYGDPVVITGTNRPLAWNNGYGFWQLSWPQWLRNSATGRTITT